MQDKLEIGDPVEVLDPGLLQMMALMGPDTTPNNHGFVKELNYGGEDKILVEFPIGDTPIEEHSQVAPYPSSMVRKRR